MAHLIGASDSSLVFSWRDVDEIDSLYERLKSACSEHGISLVETFSGNNDRQTVQFDFDGSYDEDTICAMLETVDRQDTAC